MNRNYIALDARSEQPGFSGAPPLMYFTVRDKLYFHRLGNDYIHESNMSLKSLLDKSGVEGWVASPKEVNTYLMVRELLK